MTEKEKRDAGMPYDPKELADELVHCKELCYEYNHLRPTQFDEQQALLKSLLGKTKASFLIQAPFWCDYGYNIEVGENFYANHNCVILDGEKVTFGNHVFVGPDCGFYTAGHPIEYLERNKGLEYARPIKVGNNVWFGGGVKVMPGITIGNDVVVAAGAVVTKYIPDHCIAGGNPAKVIRKL